MANASDREKSKPSKISSGASSRGTNTPSGRPSKHHLPSVKSLKRPGSPNMSEASGNESSRKKHKINGLPSSQPVQPPSRPMSPSLLPPSSSVPNAGTKRPRSNAGSGSEGEAAGSGGDVSKILVERVFSEWEPKASVVGYFVLQLHVQAQRRTACSGVNLVSISPRILFYGSIRFVKSTEACLSGPCLAREQNSGRRNLAVL